MRDLQADGSSTVTLRFAAQPEHLVLARLVLTGIAVAEGLETQVVSDLKLAVTEACTNAIEHAYANGAGATANGDGGGTGGADVMVCYRIVPGAVTIEVSDRGAGFDPEAVRAARPADGDQPQREGGMGLSIIESLVDELEISADGTGSRITFTKRTTVASAG